MSVLASDAGTRQAVAGARQGAGTARARREAVQPSLWDRLVNDLPGLASEIDGLRSALADQLGAERVDALATGDAAPSRPMPS